MHAEVFLNLHCELSDLDNLKAKDFDGMKAELFEQIFAKWSADTSEPGLFILGHESVQAEIEKELIRLGVSRNTEVD